MLLTYPVRVQHAAAVIVALVVVIVVAAVAAVVGEMKHVIRN